MSNVDTASVAKKRDVVLICAVILRLVTELGSSSGGGLTILISCPVICLQGFFCQTEDEFDDWCMRIRRVGTPPFFLVSMLNVFNLGSWFYSHCFWCLFLFYFLLSTATLISPQIQHEHLFKQEMIPFFPSCRATEEACPCLSWLTVSRHT